MANETFRVGEYLGPKDRKDLDLLAGHPPVVFVPVESLEGVPCTKIVDVMEDVFEDVVEEIEVDDVLVEEVNGKKVKRVVGKKKVEQVVGKTKVGEKKTGTATVGRKVALIYGDEAIGVFAQRTKDSALAGENYYAFAEDLEAQLHASTLKDTIVAVVTSPPVIRLLQKALFDTDEESPRRGPGRPPKNG